MTFNRIKISAESTQRLRVLKTRTGLTPNILSRLALCFSLNDKHIPKPAKSDEEGQEFNRYTLTGEWDLFFISLIKERCKQDNLDSEKELLPQFKAHLERGILNIYSRVKYIGDLDNLLPDELKSGVDI